MTTGYWLKPLRLSEWPRLEADADEAALFSYSIGLEDRIEEATKRFQKNINLSDLEGASGLLMEIDAYIDELLDQVLRRRLDGIEFPGRPLGLFLVI